MLSIYSYTILLVLLIFESKCIVVYRCLSVHCVPCIFYAAICEINDDDECRKTVQAR